MQLKPMKTHRIRLSAVVTAQVTVEVEAPTLEEAEAQVLKEALMSQSITPVFVDGYYPWEVCGQPIFSTFQIKGEE